jgi:hypothetical protein
MMEACALETVAWMTFPCLNQKQGLELSGSHLLAANIGLCLQPTTQQGAPHFLLLSLTVSSHLCGAVSSHACFQGLTV